LFFTRLGSNLFHVVNFFHDEISLLFRRSVLSNFFFGSFLLLCLALHGSAKVSVIFLLTKEMTTFASGPGVHVLPARIVTTADGCQGDQIGRILDYILDDRLLRQFFLIKGMSNIFTAFHPHYKLCIHFDKTLVGQHFGRLFFANSPGHRCGCT
jgi:hypothetical protein